MNQFYRLCSDYRDDFKYAGIIAQEGFDGQYAMLSASLFENKAEDIPSPSREFRVYYAPLWSDKYLARDFIMDKSPEIPLPDFWNCDCTPIVSEKVKAIIESEDKMQHQFWPISLYDREKKPINCQPYYRMSVRRLIRFPDTQIKVKKEFHVEIKERPLFYALECNPKLYKVLAEIPVWASFGERHVVNVSEKVYQSFIDEKLEGFKLYNRRLENVGAYCCG